MKTLFYNSILFLFALIAYPQENKNFTIDDGKVIWQKVFETELSPEQIKKQINTSGLFFNIMETEDNLTADVEKLSLDYKGFGVSEMTAPMYIARSYFNLFTIIEFKANRYRVTVKNMKLVQKYDDGLSQLGETSDLEIFALRKRNTEFKKMFLNKASGIINYTLNDVFTFKSSKNDDW